MRPIRRTELRLPGKTADADAARARRRGEVVQHRVHRHPVARYTSGHA